MSDIIRLLPDTVANQIAAGEVVQRPASAVKELLENAIDAEATKIQLVVKDAGKTLIQVIDNGKGMSEQDARLCFERHATSKISKADDLFRITTKGFRGEALASIAAIAHVELRTRQTEDEIGTSVRIEGGQIEAQEPIQCPVGSSFSIRNLFYNVPARRYFLKSDAIEFRHIAEEFHRVALTHPEIEFTLIHQGIEVHHLVPGSTRQRIIHLLGNKYQDKLVPIEETTEIVAIHGFIGKPEIAKKTRGEQYFFLNKRFIKNSYLHHAVSSAFDQILPSGHHPMYLIYLDISPDQIDINIHPTKTEVKFQDDRAIYAILHAAVKRSIGKSQLSPSLDFEQETAIHIPPASSGQPIRMPQIQVNHGFNPFEDSERKSERSVSFQQWFEQKPNPKNWRTLFEEQGDTNPADDQQGPMVIGHVGKFIITTVGEELWLIHARRAHQRLLFDRYRSSWNPVIQHLNAPLTMDIPVHAAMTYQEDVALWKEIGFDCHFSEDAVLIIEGIPSNWSIEQALNALEILMDHTDQDFQHAPSIQDSWCWKLAKKDSIVPSRKLTNLEMIDLVNDLLKSTNPEFTPTGNAIIQRLSEDQIQNYF